MTNLNKLSLPCASCGIHTQFDYCIDDDTWKKTVPNKWKLDVVCLSCLDKMGLSKGIDVLDHLEFVRFHGENKTIELREVK